MKHIVKILSLLVAISAFWIGLLQAAIIPRSHTWLLPIYFVVSLGCYGLLMVGVGLMQFPTCPQEAVLLQKDIAEAKDFFKHKGVDVGSNWHKGFYQTIHQRYFSLLTKDLTVLFGIFEFNSVTEVKRKSFVCIQK